MTVDPTALQTARLSCGQIRALWPMLGDARTSRITRPSVALSGRAAASRDADLRAERADRDTVVGYRALAASPAPVSLAVVDAEIETLSVVTATIWAVRSDLRQWSRAVPDVPHSLEGKTAWLTDMLDATAAGIVDQAADDLSSTARRLAGAVGLSLHDGWRASARRCPACRQRALHTWDASVDPREWTVECRGELLVDDRPDHTRTTPCRCTGDTCPCARPGARKGSRHLWPA